MVTLHSIFERFVLQEAERRCPQRSRGRPRELDDANALALLFKLLRTGMQWRELDCAVHYTTVLRKMHNWTQRGVFDTAYARALRTHKRLCPPTHYCVDSSKQRIHSLLQFVNRASNTSRRLQMKIG